MASIRITNIPPPPGLSGPPSSNQAKVAVLEKENSALKSELQGLRRGVAFSALQLRSSGLDIQNALQALEYRGAEIERLRAENLSLRAENRHCRDFVSRESQLMAKLGQASQDLAAEREEVERLGGMLEAAEKVVSEKAEVAVALYTSATELHDRALKAEGKFEEGVGKVEELEGEVERLRAVNGLGAVGEGSER